MKLLTSHRPVFTRAAAAALLVGGLSAAPAMAGEWSANASVTNNYIWRGLTQTMNNSAVQGGIDFVSDSGFYAGTWVSNVKYESSDAYSYEHDMYAGYGFSAGEVSMDVGYLYYNYDSAAGYDFGEVYFNVGFGGLGLGLSLLANAEPDEGPDEDFGFGSAYYVSADYGFEVGDGVGIGLHVGYHDGDFVDSFNGVDGGYADYNVSISKGGFSFMVSDTNATGDFATGVPLDNQSVKFVISYGVDLSL